jgi:hypothetical protein
MMELNQENQMTKEELIALLATAEVRSGRRRFTREMKEKTLAYARDRPSVPTVATELVIKGWTLQRWFQNERRAGRANEGPVKGFVRLEAEAEVVSRGGGLEVMLGGRSIRVPVGFDGETLSRVVAILERRGA